jgi:hypothetical protein
MNKRQWLGYGIVILVLMLNVVFAQRFSAKIDRNQVALDETFELVLTFDGVLPAGKQPNVRALTADFQMVSQMMSQAYQEINGQRSQSRSWRYTLQPKRKGMLMVPAFHLSGMSSEPFKVEVIAALSGNRLQYARQRPGSQARGNAAILGPPIQLQAKVTPKQLYPLQVGMYHLTLLSRQPINGGALSPPDWHCGEPMVQVGKDVPGSRLVKGVRYQTLTRRFMFRADHAGMCTVPAPVFVGQVVLQPQSIADPFALIGASMTRPVKQAGLAMKLKVLPIPVGIKAWLPANDVRLSRTVDHHQLKQGQPVTVRYHLVVNGQDKANLPKFTLGALPGVKIYPEALQATSTFKANQLHTELVQRFVLIPGKVKAFRLPAMRLKWWDVQQKKLRLAQLPTQLLKVQAVHQPPVLQGVTNVPYSGKSVAPVRSVGQGVDHWRTLSFSLLGLWLLTLFLYWSRQIKQPWFRGNKPEPVPVQTRAQLVKLLAQACKSGHAKRSAELLCLIGRVLWPNESITRIDQVAQRLNDKDFSQAVQALSAYLYRLRLGGAFWQGRPLWDSFKVALAAYDKTVQHVDKVNATQLPPFYPGRS